VTKIDVEVAGTFVLGGTIDGHDPIGVRFKITKGRGRNQKIFWLTVVSVNWGRGYNPGEFKRNVVLLMQEIDETDEAPEHKVTKRLLEKIMDEGTTLVEWATREPIAVSPGVRVTRRKKRMTMDQGSAIGAPDGTGPRRFFVSCVAVIEGVKIGFGNQHPHRNLPSFAVQRARGRGEVVTRQEVRELTEICDLVIHGGDMNDRDYPKSHPKEKVAIERGLDMIRYIKA
jgi:hypothetical protein